LEERMYDIENKCSRNKTAKKNEIQQGTNPLINTGKIAGHSFSAWFVAMTIRLFTNTNAGFRGIENIYEELQGHFDLKTVSYSCIRQWVLRLGYGLLTNEIERRPDWVYIMDFSIQLGTERCLLILGVTHESLEQNGYELKHHQVTILDIYVQEHFNGEAVCQRIMAAHKRTGTPYQIISDNGSDVKKGIALYCQKNKPIIQTYDVAHMIGICIKHSLADDSRWLELQSDLNNFPQRINQTELSFLAPPMLSKKGRWMNIKQEINWMDKIYRYRQNSDFSLICKGFKIKNHEFVFEKVKVISCKNKFDERCLAKKIREAVFECEEDAWKFLHTFGLSEMKDVIIIDAGQLRFEEKFEFLKKHKQFYLELQQLNNMAESIKVLVRKNGLSLDTLQDIELEYDKLTFSRVKDVFNDINNRLQNEHAKCGIENKAILCSSEIIESIFGKFKMKAKQTVGGIYETVLSIVLFCTALSEDLVRKILTSTKMSDVENWFREMSGVSNLAKRRIAFG
jgi:hypothetical protein